MNPASFANYNMAATTTNIQDCTSSNATIAAFVCSTQSSAQVILNDDGICSANDTHCSFSPSSINVTAGMTVVWHDTGSITTNHNLISNATANGSLPSFSVYVYGGNSFSSQQLFTPGTYHYYDQYHSYLKGVIIVNPAAVRPPIASSYGTSGSIGWNLAGLTQNDALLGVSHKISVYDQTTNPQTLVYNDSGIIEQYVDLGTREESPSSLGILQSVPFGLNLNGFYTGYGYGPFYYGYPGPFANYFGAPHTLWWVNGPLDNGSIVQALAGYASVTGSKVLQLGANPHDSWTVALTYAASSNQTEPFSSNNNFNFYCPYGPYFYFGGPQPQPQCFVSMSSLSVSLSADYGKQSDLLFGLTAKVSTLTQTTTQYPAGSTVFANNGFGNGLPISAPVSIVRTISNKLTFTLTFSNTNLDLSKRMPLQPNQSSSSTTSSPGGNTVSQPSPSSNLSFSPSILYFLAGAGTVALVGGAIWSIARIRRKPSTSRMPIGPTLTA